MELYYKKVILFLAKLLFYVICDMDISDNDIQSLTNIIDDLESRTPITDRDFRY